MGRAHVGRRLNLIFGLDNASRSRQHSDPTGRLTVRHHFQRSAHRMRYKAPRHGPTETFTKWVWTERA